jgi:WD40 repeat protein
MTRWRMAAVFLAACAGFVVIAGTGYVIGQGKPADPPAATGATPTAPAAAKTDLAGDPLPAGAIARLGTARFRFHGFGPWLRLTFTGTSVVGLGNTGRGWFIRSWDATTGQLTGEFSDPDLSQWSAEPSPDGTLAVLLGSASGDVAKPEPVLRLYDLSTRKPVWTVRPANADRASGLTGRFTPDGKRFLTVSGADLRVWDVQSGSELARQTVRIAPSRFELSPDGKTAALTGPGNRELYVWDWEGGANPRRIDIGTQTYVQGLAFTPDGRTVYVLGNGVNIRGFDVATRKPAGRLDVGPHAQWLSYSPDGKTLAVGYANSMGRNPREYSVALWDARTGKETGRLEAGRSHPYRGVWSRDGARFAAATENRIWVWDAASQRPVGPDAAGHDETISQLTFAPDGRLFTAGLDQTVRAWDPATGRELLKLTMANRVRGLAVSPDGSLVAGSGLRNDFRIWDAKTGKELFKLLGHGELGGQRRLRFSTDEQTLQSYGDDYYVRAWDLTSGKLKAEHQFRPASRNGMGVMDDDEEASGGGYLPRVMDFGPDGNTFVQSTDKDVQVIAVDTGKERVRFEADPQWVDALAVSADGKRLVTVGPGVPPPPKGALRGRIGPTELLVTVWDLKDVKPITKFRVPVSMGRLWGPLAFTPDGRQVVTGAFEPVLRFFDAKTGEPVGTIDLPNQPESLAFDAPGRRVAVGFLDTTALIYDVAAALKPAKKE